MKSMKSKSIVVNIEIATLDLEQALERFMDLYQSRKVKLAKDFATHLREIWKRKRNQIEQTARRLHYDAVAVIPGGVKLPEFHRQMTQGYDPTWESANFQEGGSWAGIKSFQVETDRIILFHDCLELDVHPLTKQLLGQNLFQITGLSEAELTQRIAQGKPFKGQIQVDGKLQTFDGFAPEDWLAINAERVKRTKQHLDSETCSWLIRSCCGRRVPGLLWNGDRLYAHALEPGYRYAHLAPRPAAVFCLI